MQAFLSLCSGHRAGRRKVSGTQREEGGSTMRERPGATALLREANSPQGGEDQGSNPKSQH